MEWLLFLCLSLAPSVSSVTLSNLTLSTAIPLGKRYRWLPAYLQICLYVNLFLLPLTRSVVAPVALASSNMAG